MANFRAVEQGVGEWFDRKDENGDKLTDHGKPVRVKVHALTREEEHKARQAAYGNRKSGKLNNETFLRAADRGEAYTREAAIQALEDTENHNVELSGAKAVARFAELLGLAQSIESGSAEMAKLAGLLKVGGEVCLDGKWTPELKRAYFTEFAFSKREAKVVADLSADVGTRAVDEEEQATQDFSQP